MKADIEVIVTGIKQYQMEGNKGSNIYTLGENFPPEDEDKAGLPTMKLGGEHGLTNKFNEGDFPALCKLKCEIRQGAKDSMKYHVLDVQRIAKINLARENITAPAAKAS